MAIELISKTNYSTILERLGFFCIFLPRADIYYHLDCRRANVGTCCKLNRVGRVAVAVARAMSSFVTLLSRCQVFSVSRVLWEVYRTCRNNIITLFYATSPPSTFLSSFLFPTGFWNTKVFSCSRHHDLALMTHLFSFGFVEVSIYYVDKYHIVTLFNLRNDAVLRNNTWISGINSRLPVGVIIASVP
jgi:hypothetical protein